jgi:hypothetical protein
MRRVSGLDVNGWRDIAARDWDIEEPDVQIQAIGSGDHRPCLHLMAEDKAGARSEAKNADSRSRQCSTICGRTTP